MLEMNTQDNNANFKFENIIQNCNSGISYNNIPCSNKTQILQLYYFNKKPKEKVMHKPSSD